MGDDPPKKHREYIVPGSKEHEEISKALNDALDIISEQSKQRYRREREAADIERKRRIGEGLPLRDDCYYVRYTRGMHVTDEDLDRLWKEGRVAVHLTEGGAPLEASASGVLNPKDYPKNERLTVSTILRLSRDGGYVWAETHSGLRAKVGVVRPDTPIEGFEARWAGGLPVKHRTNTDAKTVLRTLRMQRVNKVWLAKETMLRASRPVAPDHVSRSLFSWNPACGKTRLVSVFEKTETETPEAKWNSLLPTLQGTLCTEFLRRNEDPRYPNLDLLLLPPTTLGKDVDVYGMTDDGTEILAQTPFRTNRNKESFEARKKTERLRKYENTGAQLVCFVPGFEGNREDCDQDQKLFEDRSPIIRDGVLFIPVGEILEWVEAQPGYAEKLFSA